MAALASFSIVTFPRNPGTGAQLEPRTFAPAFSSWDRTDGGSLPRVFLQWSATQLAEKSGISVATIQRIEADDGFPVARGGNIEAVHKALAAAGITFLPDNEDGVGIRGQHKAKRGK